MRSIQVTIHFLATWMPLGFDATTFQLGASSAFVVAEASHLLWNRYWMFTHEMTTRKDVSRVTCDRHEIDLAKKLIGLLTDWDM